MSQKTKKRFLWIGIPVTVGVLLISTAAMAAHGGGLHGGLHGFLKPERIHQIVTWKVDDFLDKIDATETQRTQIHAIKDRLLEESLALHRDMADAHGVFLDEWKKDDPNLQIITAQIDEKAELKTAFARKVADAIVEVHGLLTPEQRNLIATEIEGKMAMVNEFFHEP